MAATCEFCNQPMDGRGCTGHAIVEGFEYYRVPHDGDVACNDCAAPPGELHHPGCDVERCPRCLFQAISCGCRWAGDPLWGGDTNPESPHARRMRLPNGELAEYNWHITPPPDFKFIGGH